MNFLLNCVKGIGIGAGAILPGISSGVLCVVFGIYEKLLNSVLHLFKNFKENIKFLLPILIGGILGVILFSNSLNYLLSTYPIQTKSIFIGLILGTIPSLVKTINKKEKFRLHFLLYTLFAFIIGILSVVLEKYITFNNDQSFSFAYLFISGFIMSVGIIVPGVSSTIILMLLNVYPIYLSSLSSLYFPVLLPIGLGLSLGCIVTMKLTEKLLDKFYAQTFYAIIGFTLGSTLVLFPTLSFDISIIIAILCIILGFIISNNFVNKG